MNTSQIEKVFSNLTKFKDVHEAFLLIENLSGTFSLSQSYGERGKDAPMLMASITKLLTTTCILRLIEQGKVDLEDALTKYLPEEVLKGLHVYKGREYSYELTIRHLLFQTSGLPGFYLNGADSIFKKVVQEDFSYTFEEELKWVKERGARFRPGSKEKAYYADINFDLLGKVIEAVYGGTLEAAYEQYIFRPLQLQRSYLVTKSNHFVPHTYYKEKRLERPAFIKSSYASGGGVTTPRELMIFLKAFWSGQLFDKACLNEPSKCQPLQLTFYPMCYGGGYMQMDVGYPWGKKTRIIGHSGSTGSFAYYCPEKELFLVGDLPQIATNRGGKLLAYTTLNLG